jgi:hypothetical protein
MAVASASSVYAVKFGECRHLRAKNIVKCLEHRRTLLEVFEDEHGSCSKSAVGQLKVECVLSGGEVYQIPSNLTVADIKDINSKHLHFQCNETTSAVDGILMAADHATKCTVDAFQVLMAGGREFVKEKTSR